MTLMEKNIQKNGIDNSYAQWIKELKQRYLSARLKAATAVNVGLLEFYWSIGADIERHSFANTYGSGFFKKMSHDLQRELPDVKGLSEINLRYMQRFYSLYADRVMIAPQPAEQLSDANIPQPVEYLEGAKVPAPVKRFSLKDLCSIPWSHHRYIIDKCKGNADKAIFFVKKTLENGWGRNVLLNFLDTDLYEREGKAVTNFKHTLPAVQSDLAQQITKDPYNFDFLTLREKYDERDLEDALVSNVTHFLLELGKGFSFMGRQFRLNVGEQEFFPDLLFYNVKIHAYYVVELKITTFNPEYLGQLSFYVNAINHQFKQESDNPTIGLLICKDKDNVVAQYSLESYNQPIGVSEYQLSKLYPENFKSSLPTIEEIEESLSDE